jgi:type I restriction enzyme S subunit
MKTNWPIKKLGEVCDLVRGSEPGSAAYIKESIDTIPFLRVGDLSGKVDDQKYISKKFKNILIINPREILITFDGTPGIVTKGLYGAISSGIRVVRNIKQDEILKDFLFYYLQTPPIQETIRFYTTGVTILHASRSIPHIKIKIPPLSIQQKIVERLNSIRKAQELNEKQIESAEELFQSLLNKELNPKGKNWGSRKLGELSKVIRGASPRPKGDPKYFGGIIPWIKISDITKETDPFYLTRTEEGVTEEGKNKSVFLKKGTLIVTNSGTVGVPRVLAIDGCIHDGFLAFLNLKPIIKRDFLYYQFLKIKKRLNRIAPSGTQRNLNTTIVKNLKMPLPPLETQQRIVEKLSAVQNYRKKLLKQKQLLQELFESTLNKEMSGELVK